MHASEALAHRLHGAVRAVVPEALEAVSREAKNLCPVDAGELRDSLHVRMAEGVSGAQGEVVADVPYAAFVELGTGLNAPQPYLYPAFALVRSRVAAMLKTLLG